MNLSKSRYTLGIRCKKLLWLSCFKKAEAEDLGNESVLENGNKVGDLARSLFGNYTLINYDSNYKNMIDDTRKELLNKPNIICEASFSYDGNFCSVDILKNDIDGVEIYEVKSSADLKSIYIDDVAYQTWVLKKLGLNVKKSFVVYVNRNYVKNGEFDINKYFIIEDVTNEIDLDKVEREIKSLKEIINSKDEPNIDLSLGCKKPYDCPFFKYCTKNLKEPNVFNVGWNVHFKKKLELYYKGIIAYKEILDAGGFNEKANEQMRFELYDLPPKINKDKIKKFLSQISYPLYFLDFESYQESIPAIDGTKPYQQLCFQYSLHYYLKEDSKLYHKEYLSDDYNGNPMYGLCKQLCIDIPKNSCVLVYNKTFEVPRLKEMANLFPEFSDHLLNIADNIVDLLVPFQNHDYYVKEMAESASIKKVLPALFPNDPSLDYHNLEQVHKGDEASNAYLSLRNLPKEEELKLRDNMLKYCCLDTYAMVKIYDKLKEVVKER